MSSHRISLLNGKTMPGVSGDVFQQPYPLLATNDKWKFAPFAFANSGNKDALHGAAEVPSNYVGTVSMIVVYTSASTGGAGIVWEVDYRAVGGSDVESLDQATAQESLLVVGAVPGGGAPDRRMEAAMTVTASNLAADDTLEWILYRNSGHGSDDHAATVTLIDFLLKYADA